MVGNGPSPSLTPRVPFFRRPECHAPVKGGENGKGVTVGVSGGILPRHGPGTVSGHLKCRGRTERGAAPRASGGSWPTGPAARGFRPRWGAGLIGPVPGVNRIPRHGHARQRGSEFRAMNTPTGHEPIGRAAASGQRQGGTLFTDGRIDILSKGCIVLFSLVSMLLATMTPTVPIGESANYMLATISLENRLSLYFTDADVAQAKVDFPEHYDFIDSCYHSERTWTAPDGRKHCYYFSVYSLLCIPAKHLLSGLGLNQSYAFAVTNVLLYVLALWVVYFYLRGDRKAVLLAIVLLACSPTLLYYFWPGSEICIFALLVISLVGFANHHHKMAALFVSIAGMMNVTVMAYGAMIIVDYFLRLRRGSPRDGKSEWPSAFKDNRGNTFLLALCFVPCLIPFLYNYAQFGVLTLAAPGVFRGAGYAGRFMAYLTDLNFGILPYFPVCLALLAAGVIYALCRRKFGWLILPAAFVLTMSAYCVNFHINCGMTGIHRYNAWAFALMVFALIGGVSALADRPRLKKCVYGLLMVSALLTAYTVWIVRTSPTGMIYTEMGPMAAAVLDRFPQWYAPQPATFISRVTHVDGGYVYDEPVIYFNEEGYARKMLVTPETAAWVFDQVDCGAADRAVLQAQVDKARRGSGFQYINLNATTRIVARGTDGGAAGGP